MMPGRTTARPRRRRLRALPRALGVVLLAWAVLLPAVLGGMPYVWCAPMARAQLACCCHRTQPSQAAAAETGSEAHLEARCCEGRRVSSLPRSRAPLEPDTSIAPSPLVSVLPLDLWLAPGEGGDAQRTAAHVRLVAAGVGPPLFELYRVYLC